MNTGANCWSRTVWDLIDLPEQKSTFVGIESHKEEYAEYKIKKYNFILHRV